MKTPLLPLPLLLALAACDGASDRATAPATETPAPEPAGTPAANEIPAAIQGRWGLVAADCEPGRDDAKGLLTIGPASLEFYESVGTLDDIEQVGANHIRADFDFTGEGQEWEREILLELEQDGAALVRREYGDDAAPDAFRYTKCG